MSDTATPDTTSSGSFWNGIAENFFGAVGTVGAAYVTAKAQQGSTTPGAGGAGTPAAATGNPAAISGMTTGNIIKYVAIGAAVLVLALVGIKLLKK